MEYDDPILFACTLLYPFHRKRYVTDIRVSNLEVPFITEDKLGKFVLKRFIMQSEKEGHFNIIYASRPFQDFESLCEAKYLCKGDDIPLAEVLRAGMHPMMETKNA